MLHKHFPLTAILFTLLMLYDGEVLSKNFTKFRTLQSIRWINVFDRRMLVSLRVIIFLLYCYDSQRLGKRKRELLEVMIVPNREDYLRQHSSWMSSSYAHWSTPKPKPRSWIHLLLLINARGTDTREPYTRYSQQTKETRKSDLRPQFKSKLDLQTIFFN